MLTDNVRPKTLVGLKKPDLADWHIGQWLVVEQGKPGLGPVEHAARVDETKPRINRAPGP